MKKTLLLIIVIAGLFFGCNSGKSVVGFKEMKKSIDTLLVLPISVHIKTVDYFKKQTTDPELEEVVSSNILNQVNNVLSEKYKILLPPSGTDSDSQFIADLEQMTDYLDKHNKRLFEIYAPVSFNEIKKNLTSRYSLILTVRSQYCINFPPEINPGTSSVLWINPLYETYIHQYLFVIDNLNNQIIHYNKSTTVGNISVKLSVEQITLKSLKELYYK